MSTRPLRIAGIGCGNRTTTYMTLAATMPEHFKIAGGADPISWKVDRIARLANYNEFRSFKDERELLSVDRFADVLIIGTQDHEHLRQCIAAMEKGYDVLLEKPMATRPRDVLALEAVANQLGRRVLVCHVLRYTPFYQKIKNIVSSGVLGEVITVHSSEGVGTFHQAHSFVRGNWSVVDRSSPMILQKSCHDLDIIHWIIDKPFVRLSSFGGLSHFTLAHKPQDAPPHCTDGCPVGDRCQYNALRYLTDQRRWLPYVYGDSENPTDDDIRNWLKVSPWGRCVYQCDNSAVDQQVLNVEFQGGATATFTMSAFDTGRNLEIWGTDAVLRGGFYTKSVADCDIFIRKHADGASTRITIDTLPAGDSGHSDGDRGLMEALYDEMHSPEPLQMRSSLGASVQSHLMAFAAERSRIDKRTIEASELLYADSGNRPGHEAASSPKCEQQNLNGVKRCGMTDATAAAVR